MVEKIVRKCFFTLLVLFSPAVIAVEFDSFRSLPDDLGNKLCAKAKTTLDMNQCMSEIYKEVDFEFNRIFKTINSSLKSEGKVEEQKKMKSAQLAWIKYRDADVGLVYQHWIDGSIRGTQASSRKIDMTLHRLYELKRMYLHLFYPKIQESDLLGRWVEYRGKETWIEFSKHDKHGWQFECGYLKKTATGTFLVEDGFLELKSEESCGFEESQWIYIEPFPLSGPEQVLQLQFLTGGGDARERFNRN